MQAQTSLGANGERRHGGSGDTSLTRAVRQGLLVFLDSVKRLMGRRGAGLPAALLHASMKPVDIHPGALSYAGWVSVT